MNSYRPSKLSVKLFTNNLYIAIISVDVYWEIGCELSTTLALVPRLDLLPSFGDGRKHEKAKSQKSDFPTQMVKLCYKVFLFNKKVKFELQRCSGIYLENKRENAFKINAYCIQILQ